jgi:hypothetical protein
VTVSDADSKARVGIRFDSADVSGGGAFLRSDMLFEVGELLVLQFALPNGASPRAGASCGLAASTRGRIASRAWASNSSTCRPRIARHRRAADLTAPWSSPS